jgi:2-keto-3-deoxy-L-rhamnonate aldolase RhmA
MFVTNRPDVALIAEESGIDRIFVDMEYIGKALRQGGMDTLQSRHTVEDVKRIKSVLTKSECLVRINPIHDATSEYTSSEEEIDAVVRSGADIIMLPYFKTLDEVKLFVDSVDKRCRTMLLFETSEAVDLVDDILEVEGIDEVHIGLNDLSLGYGKKFMFELLVDGTVERLCNAFRKHKHISYGFGGITSLGKGMLPAEHIIAEHYRLGSSCAILSRSFCNLSLIDSIEEIRRIFLNGASEIRAFEEKCKNNTEFLIKNREQTSKIISEILLSLK